MRQYPVLDLQEALDDAARNLAEAHAIVESLLDESDGLYPAAGSVLLTNVAAVRALLARILPATVQAEIAREELRYAEEEAYWSRD